MTSLTKTSLNYPQENTSSGALKSLSKTGWMDDLRFYVLFNSISVISGRLAGDTERLCATELRLRLKISPYQVGLKPGTARLLGQR